MEKEPKIKQEAEKKPWVRPKSEYVYSEEVEEIALRAAEMEEFQDVVKQSKSRFEALRDVRGLLRQHFPEIDQIPEPKVEKTGLMPPAGNEFEIAKYIVDLLFEK